MKQYFENSLIIHKEKTNEIDVYLTKTWLNFTSNFLDQNNPKSKLLLVQEWVDLYLRFWSQSKKVTVVYYQA